MNESLTIRDALKQYYVAHGLPPDGGADRAYFIVHLGPLRMPLPNPGIRKRALLCHDLNHLLTGYNTVFSEGEMIIAGFEIGVGCGRFAIAWIINLWMLALGLFVTPRAMFVAFVRGRRCQSVYRLADEREQFMDMTIGQMRHRLDMDQPMPRITAADRVRFALWCAVAWLVTLGSAAIPIAAAWGIVNGAVLLFGV